MTLTVSDAGGVYRQPVPVPSEATPLAERPVTTGSGAAEPAYHPQVQPPAASGGAPSQGAGGSSPYALPAGSTLRDTAGGTQAQPFDVTLSQLATAVYGTRGDPPPGWSAVTDADIATRLGLPPNDPATAGAVRSWREEFLGGGEQTKQQEFKAEIYTDGSGNFVLSYRGTAEGMDDWMNNFTQGTGFTTDGTQDKFSGTAVNTAMEFQRLFGDHAEGGSSNLAITGHSQGGGLASVGSLATGIPAVTFDASGIHPNTLERMGFTPQQARDFAENGGIRAYSLHSDLLTQAQESGVTGLLAPDALGTKIVVEPGPVARHLLVGNAADVEFDLPAPVDAVLNGLVEGARNSHIPLVDGIGDLAYAAFSHNPNVLTAAMVERAPWQAGYQNPVDGGKTLQDLLPDPLKDDYAINTHDFIADVVDVANTDFANGDYVQGGFSILGDGVEGFWNSTGDTLNRGAESLAQTVDDHVDGLPGDLLSGAINFGGDVAQGTADVVGTVSEAGADAVGWVAQKGTDLVGWLTGR